VHKKHEQTVKVILAAAYIASTVGITHIKARTLTLDQIYTGVYSQTVNARNVRTQMAINQARIAIESLRGTGAEWAIGEFSKQVDQVQHPFLVTIVDAITKAQKSIRQADINAARATIDPDLPQLWKNSYSSALDMTQESLMKQLVDACNLAVITKTSDDKDTVNQLINELNTATNPDIGKWVADYTKPMRESWLDNVYYYKLGNTIGNNNNNGMFVLKNDSLYTNTIDSNYIYKTKIDGTEKKVLNIQPSSYLNVVDNYIFYINSQDRYRLYRMNTDGSNIICLNSADEVDSIIAYDGYIYYSNYKDGGKIYRIKFDGSGRTKVTDDPYARYINAYGNYLYYSAEAIEGGGAMFRVNLDGNNRTLINRNRCGYEIVENGTIYFINESDKYNLYKMNLDGTNVKKLNNDNCSYLNISGNVLYYKNNNDNGKIYAIKTDGTLRTPVTSEDAYYLNIAGGKIYYKTKLDYGVTHSTNLVNMDNDEAPISSAILGNLPGNINNVAFAGSDGKNIYVNENGIYRYNNDYTNRVLIGTDTYNDINYLNISNGWVYYASMNGRATSENQKIYKIKADGSGEKIQLSTNRAFYMTVAGDWIYYTTEEIDTIYTGGGPIHKVRTDGTGETYVNFDYGSYFNDYAAYLNVYDDYIYYVNTKDNMTIYRVKTDGTGREKILNEKATGLNVVGGYIYYSSDYYGQLKRVPISGGASVILKDYVKQNFIVTSDKIYYVNGQSIYSSNHDGSSETFITNCTLWSQINIAGNYLYYIDDSGSTNVLKIK
jgi:hypothetical protein